MGDWKEYKIIDIIEEIAMGPFGSNIKRENYVDFGVPYLNGSNLSSYQLNEDSFYYVTEDKAKSLGRCVAKRGDIIVTHRGTIGQISYIPYDSKYETYLTGNSQFRVSVNNSLIRPDFLVYYFHTRIGQHKLLSNASQVGVPALARPTSTFKELTISIPPLNVQNHIMDIILSIDNKIECNKRINEILEQQAQALFKSWFVDFEPFKDHPFVESELGMIPQGWKLKYVSDIPHVLETGRRPKGGIGELTCGVPSVGAEHVKGMGNFDYSKTKYITEKYASSLKTGRVNGYELLIYKDGGKPGYFIPNYSIFGEGYPYEECYLNEHVFKLDFNDKGYNAFCYFYFKTDYVMNYLNAQGGKAAIPGINRQDIENILIYSPENEYVLRFGEFVLPIIKQMLFNCKESRRLAELRDALLPKLMSGEINVDDVT